MKQDFPKRPSFWDTVLLLLKATRARSAGRRRRQQELLHQRGGTDWGGFGYTLAILFMGALNVGAAFVVRDAVEAGQRVSAERQGKIVVSRNFINEVESAKRSAYSFSLNYGQYVQPDYSAEAKRIAEERGGDKKEIEGKLRNAVRDGRTDDFIEDQAAAPGLQSLSRSGQLALTLGSVVLIWWWLMLIFQGEGVELDLQRRRHPMWEWLFSHPVQPGAVFLAEMLSPIAANPIYWTAPLFVGCLYGFAYDAGTGFVATFLIGIPITVSAACLGKAFEIGVILRFPPRSRGAIIGLMGWLGYASLMLFFLGWFVAGKVMPVLAKLLGFLTVIPWPWLKLFLGETGNSFSFIAGVTACWIFSGITLAGAVWFSVWGAEQGLSGNTAHADAGPRTGRVHFGREPLYRKEFLWFARDRSAIVQAILIPLTVAGVQLFNLRGILSYAQGAWNYICGAGILFGTYFLWILGPKSLASEGTALWIALTWPRGLENLLKAKAWLWSMISNGMVALVLCYAAFLFPHNIGPIVLVGIAWFFFGRTMAEKTVTLVTVPSSSGEQEKIPWSRRAAAQLGMLTFAIGVLTQQWHIAVMGIVYSYITAAAMWQNFRARLPYLFDVWSEKLPPAPTLMHGMIAISILVEAGAVLTGMIVAAVGREGIAVAQAISYGICAVIVSIGMANFLSGRGVLGSDIWQWRPESEPVAGHSWRDMLSLRGMALGGIAGLILGFFAAGYMSVLRHLPITSEILRKSQEEMAKMPYLKVSFAVMAVAFAPFAEEYLFRGVLYRALDKEWGGWRAVLGSAAFFAIYHSPLAWLPVAFVGACNAMLFKRSGRLAPAVVLHMVYNAVVVMMQ